MTMTEMLDTKIANDLCAFAILVLVGLAGAVMFGGCW